MSIRRFTALMATAGLIVALAACGGGGNKNESTKTPGTKTPRITGTTTPQTTPASGETPGASAPTSQDVPGGGTTPANGDTQPPDVSSEQVDYQVQFTVASDPGNLQPLVESDDSFDSRLTVVIGDGAISVDSDSPFIAVTGTIDASGAFTATGMGRVEPYRNVEATFQGTISNGQLTGTYTIGTNGTLPGSQPITYNVTGTGRMGSTPTQ